MARNVDLIHKNISLRLGGITGLIALTLIVLGYSEEALSCLLGLASSYAVFRQLIQSQDDILKMKKKSLFFPKYMIRLVVYAVPVGIALFFKDYLNLYLVLLFLFSFQAYLVLFEGCRSYKRVKRKKWIN